MKKTIIYAACAAAIAAAALIAVVGCNNNLDTTSAEHIEKFFAGFGDNGGGNNTGGGGVGVGNTCGKDGTAGSCKTVVIGSQTWFAENLNYQTGNSWCYNDSSSYCNKYGRLYIWEVAKSACQSVGWRLPTREDWNALVTAADGSTDGKALKSKSGWNNNGNGTDSYGFSALPAGLRSTGGSFGLAGDSGHWWTATENGSGNAYRRSMGYDYDGVDEYYLDVGFGFSVRCVKDD